MKRNLRTKKDRITRCQGIGFTVSMLGFVLLCCEAGSLKGQIITAVIGIAVIGLGMLIFNLKKVVFFLAEKESALSVRRPNRAHRKDVTYIVTNYDKVVK